MLVYIALPMFLLPSMMAISAMGTCPTIAYHLETLPLTQEHIEVLVVGSEFHSNTFTSINNTPSTIVYPQNCVDNPTNAADICSNHHHDHQRSVNLGAICNKIEHSNPYWEALLSALVLDLTGAEEHNHNITTSSTQQLLLLTTTMTMMMTEISVQRPLLMMIQPVTPPPFTTLDEITNLQHHQ